MSELFYVVGLVIATFESARHSYAEMSGRYEDSRWQRELAWSGPQEEMLDDPTDPPAEVAMDVAAHAHDGALVWDRDPETLPGNTRWIVATIHRTSIAGKV